MESKSLVCVPFFSCNYKHESRPIPYIRLKIDRLCKNSSVLHIKRRDAIYSKFHSGGYSRLTMLWYMFVSVGLLFLSDDYLHICSANKYLEFHTCKVKINSCLGTDIYLRWLGITYKQQEQERLFYSHCCENL